MSGRARLFFAALLLLVALLASAGSEPIRAQSSKAAPRAVRGTLDLTGFDLTRASVVLDGEWEFYRGDLHDPGAFADPDAAPTPSYITVPGGWKDEADAFGFGTYRLRVEGLDETEPLALYVPFVPTAYKAWVNGRLVASHGVVASDAAAARPTAGTSLAPVEPGASAVEIVLHVSNFSFRDGGLTRSPVFGTYENVYGSVRRSLVLAAFLSASLLFIGLYHVGLWAIRQQHKQLLWFGLLSLSIGLRMTVMDQAPILLFLPDIPWEVLLKIEYIGFYLAVPFFIVFLRELFPEEFEPRIVHGISYAGAAAGLFVVVTPARVHSHALLVYELFTGAVFAYALWALGRAVRRRRNGAFVILAAVSFMTVVALNDTLFYWGYLRLGAYSPFAVLVVLGAHSFLLSKQFSDEFERQKKLTEEKRALLEIVQRQVVQIRESRRQLHAREDHVRRSVAELLHGTVQSRLLLARHHLRKGLRLLQSPSASAEAAAREANVDEVLENLRKAEREIDYIGRTEIRNISRLLHPMTLRLGLVPALKSMAEQYAEHFTVRVHVSERWPSEEGGNGEEHRFKSLLLTVYRIVEEALSNVMKHASASSVDVYLDSDGRRTVSVAVEDNGVGWRGPAPEAGFGLGMIAARVEDAGGTWKIESEPGRGTRLTVRLPIQTGGEANVKEDAENEKILEEN